VGVSGCERTHSCARYGKSSAPSTANCMRQGLGMDFRASFPVPSLLSGETVGKEVSTNISPGLPGCSSFHLSQRFDSLPIDGVSTFPRQSSLLLLGAHAVNGRIIGSISSTESSQCFINLLQQCRASEPVSRATGRSVCTVHAALWCLCEHTQQTASKGHQTSISLE